MKAALEWLSNSKAAIVAANLQISKVANAYFNDLPSALKTLKEPPLKPGDKIKTGD